VVEILGDRSKEIAGDLQWSLIGEHEHLLGFRADVVSNQRWPIFINASYNPEARTLSYALIHRGFGARIYGLCMGKAHRNPDTGQNMGELHKHQWRDPYRDQYAYIPADITASIEDPFAVWREFCSEALIEHRGQLLSGPPKQLELP